MNVENDQWQECDRRARRAHLKHLDQERESQRIEDSDHRCNGHHVAEGVADEPAHLLDVTLRSIARDALRDLGLRGRCRHCGDNGEREHRGEITELLGGEQPAEDHVRRVVDDAGGERQ